MEKRIKARGKIRKPEHFGEDLYNIIKWYKKVGMSTLEIVGIMESVKAYLLNQDYEKAKDKEIMKEIEELTKGIFRK